MYIARDIGRIGSRIELLCDVLCQLLTKKQIDDFQIGKVTIDAVEEDTWPAVEVTGGFDDLVKAWDLEPKEKDGTRYFTIDGDDIIFYEGK
jgi:hypothetical protein